MDVNDPRFEEYQSRFEAVADKAEPLKGPQPAIASARYHLCLYGDNGLTPEDEFQILSEIERYADQGLKKTTIQTGYWEDIVLFVPQESVV